MKTKIGKKETSAVLINLICMKLFVAFPRFLTKAVGNSSWITAILSLMAIILIFFILEKFYKSEKDIFTLAKKFGGNGLKITVGTAMFIILFFNMAFTVRCFPDSVRIVLLQNTSVTVIVGLLFVACVIGVFSGIESISRITSLFLPVAGAVFFIFLLLLIPFLNPLNIMPIFTKEMSKVFSALPTGVSFFSDLVALYVLLPFCNNKKEAFYAAKRAILISGMTFCLVFLAICLIFPSTVSSELTMPFYQLTRMVKIGDFFARTEALFGFFWCILMMLYVSVYVFCLAEISRKSLNLNARNIFVFPILMLLIAFYRIFDTIVYTIKFYGILTVVLGFATFFVLILPIGLERKK